MSKFKTNLIKAILVTSFSGTIFGVGIKGVTSLSSGSTVKDVIKDIAVGSIKTEALDSIYGNDNNALLLKDLVNTERVTLLKETKQSWYNQFSKKYYTEAYCTDNTAYLGDRRFNQPYNLNFSWNMTDATGFEIASYKSGVPSNNTYIIYDTNSAILSFCELQKTKLKDYVVVYDMYNDTLSFNYYKDDICISLEDNTVTYKKSDSIKAYYNFEQDTFGKEIKGKFKDIDFDGYTYTFFFDDKTISYNIVSKILTYVSDSCDFEGNAFNFTCRYDYNDKDYVLYNYEVLKGVVAYYSDGTEGSIYITNNTDSNLYSLSDILQDIGLSALSSCCLDYIEAGIPAIRIVDLGMEALTGNSLDDVLFNAADNFVDDVKENGLDSAIDNIAEEIDPENILNNIRENKDSYDYETRIANIRDLILQGYLSDTDLENLIKEQVIEVNDISDLISNDLYNNLLQIEKDVKENSWLIESGLDRYISFED